MIFYCFVHGLFPRLLTIGMEAMERERWLHLEKHLNMQGDGWVTQHTVDSAHATNSDWELLCATLLPSVVKLSLLINYKNCIINMYLMLNYDWKSINTTLLC